jgi:hypothetical protein
MTVVEGSNYFCSPLFPFSFFLLKSQASEMNKEEEFDVIEFWWCFKKIRVANGKWASGSLNGGLCDDLIGS